MKLVRFGEKGRERPGVVATDGSFRDVSSIVDDFSPETLSGELLRKLRSINLDAFPKVPASTRIAAPLSRTGHFIAIGLNYADHAEETGSPIPAEPIIFSKASSCLSGPNDTVYIPRGAEKCDWELELAIIIGKGGSYIEESDAIDHVLGYAICNDVSERAYQLERGGQWVKGKSAPTFGPVGPWIVTTDEIADPHNLSMFLELNGQKVQSGSTKTMIFSVAQIVSYCSNFMLLEPGDIITTGTPPGVGMGQKPPRFLKDGDTMRLHIEGLGEQKQSVSAAGTGEGRVRAA
ncbi:fumarylacetoacetate hydrolase family protein (plasmid) [Agrobacterium leguminum]|uniref:Isomerase/Decarboxylase related protein family putative 2-hydroxyhepta-2,4-diene-1,7-dioate isomerase n=1 Tax=Agrobacterium deltaense NCPPB 1641 TaxID=1183425 RepID=A0A1S7U9H6_9HYPH|nr:MULTISPECIES: fumarylacetoacetate hydrolase family protein [Agrobacterium]WFS70104.1 fumarylacetoacetate hydrolase family protein [Agrobacterium leguminum]CVI63517.1 putative Isomerase/Decarboxylase related protein family; putative 2-hydroxyhepta-2,4-diene-1,7-dioate isomerase [Agrobacterium deltaense NCPPB 1641]